MEPTVCAETSVTTSLRYVTSKKNEDLMHTAAEPSNYANRISSLSSSTVLMEMCFFEVGTKNLYMLFSHA